MNIITLFLIGLSLSMDTFSLSLSLGLFNINYKRLFCIFVGIFHFIMPSLGNMISNIFFVNSSISSNVILTIVFFVLTITMIIDLISHNEPILKITIIGIILLAFSVSIDSFMIGLVIDTITKIPLIGYAIFMVCAYSFTKIGLFLGNYAYKKLDKYAKLLGLVVMLVLFFTHLLNL